MKLPCQPRNLGICVFEGYVLLHDFAAFDLQLARTELEEFLGSPKHQELCEKEISTAPPSSSQPLGPADRSERETKASAPPVTHPRVVQGGFGHRFSRPRSLRPFTSRTERAAATPASSGSQTWAKRCLEMPISNCTVHLFVMHTSQSIHPAKREEGERERERERALLGFHESEKERILAQVQPDHAAWRPTVWVLRDPVFVFFPLSNLPRVINPPGGERRCRRTERSILSRGLFQVPTAYSRAFGRICGYDN